jgi:hypothetical protein
MDKYESLSHKRCKCKYHAVFIPKCSGRSHLSEVYRNWRVRRRAG